MFGIDLIRENVYQEYGILFERQENKENFVSIFIIKFYFCQAYVNCQAKEQDLTNDFILSVIFNNLKFQNREYEARNKS